MDMTPPGWLTRVRGLNELIPFTDFAVNHMGFCKLRVEQKVRKEPDWKEQITVFIVLLLYI